ncbi:hypothetical protein [Paludisphaera mucosa]|uniref:Zinc ribbon domain-containing protein n=1 Tax=Paludisphaera mucosa TaxID=3030827 RepID=A0ABT6F3Y2_9BACT|nr:hypothetical protein [Paludisphaera mucosa]MDG3002292.1 hypothetical protein [Paludisphaera mucosa]
MEYEDDHELTRYVWSHFRARMTDDERRVGSAIVGREKAALIGAKPDHPLAVRWGRTDDPEINAALTDGPEAFRRRVCKRVLAEAADESFVNRCPKCRRVVRTPKARQCFWCGFDWHGGEP